MKPDCVNVSKHDLIKFRIVAVFIDSNMRQTSKHVTVDKKVKRLAARGIIVFCIISQQVLGPTEHPSQAL